MTFEEICKAYEEHDAKPATGLEWVKEGNAIEDAFEIEETQCLCYCCRHSGVCPMEDSHNTTYGTFVTSCHYVDYIEED